MAITFPTTLDSFSDKVDNVDDVQAVDINDVQDAIEALETKMGINSSAVTASLDYKVNNFFASGRKVYLYENTAPTGWSIVAVTDAVLSVKGGSNAYNTTGGTQAGTWTQPNHTLTINELASHSHDVLIYGGTGGTPTLVSGFNTGTPTYSVPGAAEPTGGGAAHNHGTAYRPSAAVGIICTKS